MSNEFEDEDEDIDETERHGPSYVPSERTRGERDIHFNGVRTKASEEDEHFFYNYLQYQTQDSVEVADGQIGCQT